MPAGNSTQILTLSLFLKLLAFFLLLNSVSQHTTERTQKVADSLRLSLGNKVERGTGSSMIPGLQEQRGQGASLADTAGAFQAELPGLKSTYIRQRGIMTVTVAASELNRLLGLAGALPMDPRLRDLFETVKSARAPGYQVLFQVNIRPDIYDHIEHSGYGMTAYLPMWAAALARAGIDPARTILAVGPGQAGTITMRIMPVMPDNKGGP